MDKLAGQQRFSAISLGESEQRLRALVEGMALTVWQTDSTGSQMVESASWVEVTASDVHGDSHWLDAVHPDDREAIGPLWQCCVDSKCRFTAEFRIRCQVRGWCWTQAHAAPLLNDAGQVTKWVGMNVDITERKLAEQQLLKNQRQMSLALDIARMGFWSLDPVTQRVSMDARMRNVWGESSDAETPGAETLSMDVVLSRIHPDDRPLVSESVNAALDPNGSGYYKPTDYRLVLDDGSTRWIAANGMTIYSGRGQDRKAIELFGTVLDITHRKVIEDSLRESEERLQQLNSVLEDRVKERTRELVDSEARLRHLALELSRTEERERRRLARVLHDHVQQLLVGAKMRVEALCTPHSAEETQEQIVGITTVLDVAINATRTLAVELVPPILQTQGLPVALQWLAEHVEDHHKLVVRLNIESAANPTSEEVRDLLFQAAREFLLNVMKHAQVPQATLTLSQSSHQIMLSVSDEGAGFSSEASDSSTMNFGLFHLRERAMALGGELTIQSQRGRGTTVTIALPVG